MFVLTFVSCPPPPQSEAVIERQTAIAKELLKTGKQSRAKLALQLRKYHLGLIEKMDAQLQNVEEMVNSIQFAEVQQEVFQSLKQGKETLECEFPPSSVCLILILIIIHSLDFTLPLLLHPTLSLSLSLFSLSV